MRPRDLSLLFIVGLVCVALLLREPSLMSVVLVFVLVATVYTFKHDTHVYVASHEAFAVLKQSDASMQGFLSALEQHSSFDPDLHATVVGQWDSFLNLYTRLLMFGNSQPRTLLKQDFQNLLDIRKEILYNLDTFVFKSSKVCIASFKTLVIIPFLEVSRRYVMGLTRKHECLYDWYQQTLLSSH